MRQHVLVKTARPDRRWPRFVRVARWAPFLEREPLRVWWREHGMRTVTNEEANKEFISFYTMWRGKLFKAVAAWTGDRHAAEDVVQEVMILVRHYWGRYPRPEILMYRLARQQLARRTGGIPMQLDSLDQRHEASDSLAGPTRDLDEQLDLLAALRRLPTRQREVVVLTELCDLDQATAAEILGISVSALKTHKARGLRTLQSRLAGAGTDIAGGNDA